MMAFYTSAEKYCLLKLCSIMLLAFQVQVLQWTGDLGSSPELASLG